MTPVASDRTASWAGEETQLLPPGHRVGDWIVTEPIGSGGWATVYAARAADGPGEGSTGGAAEGPAEAALKVLPTAGLGPHQARKVAEAARREVALARTAPHPRLVRLLDTLVLAAPGLPALDGAIVLVMERARCSLRELLHTGIDAARGARIVTGICEGLAHLHGSGWVHTDLKPENVLVGDDGEVRLSDFGFAIELTGTHGYAAPMGTLDYLPPERWKEPLGEHGVRIRPTADIWALGIVIHEVFAAGASPFPGATPTQRGAAVQEYAEGRAALRMDHALPEFWRALAADCLAPGHTARAPHTADSLLARIRTEQPAAPPRRRRGTRAALLTLVGCLLAGGGGALWWYAADASGTHGPGRGAPAAGPAGIRVFNAERGCQGRTDREPQCSLGLAVDPRRAYTAENVVPTRVWHGDVLDAECRLARGKPIIDEEDLTSTVWYRVRLPGPDRAATAWLPAVRTKDRPDLPPCP